MNFLATPKVMSIASNLTISGINETTFKAELQSVLENIIANMTNSSASTVNAIFIDMVSSIATRNAVGYSHLSKMRFARSDENNALINVAVNPRDSPHEAFVISRMNAPKHFKKELNLGLKNQGLTIKPIVITVSQITPYPGTLIYIIRLQKFYNTIPL